MKIFLHSIWILIGLLLATPAFPQAGRPPVTTIGGLSDVSITSPANGQPLVFSTTDSKWHNGGTMLAPVITDSASTSSWDFGAETMSIGGSVVLNWSGANLELFAPLYDNVNKLSVNATARTLTAADGTSTRLDWSGSSVKIPGLNTNGYVVTTNGDGTLAVSTASAIGGGVQGPNTSTTGALSAWGNASGNLLTDSRWTVNASHLQTYDAQNTNAATLVLQNQSNGNAADTEISLANDAGSMKFALYSTGFSTAGVVGAGDFEIRGPGTGDVIIDTTGRLVFSNDSGTTESFAVTQVGFGGRTTVTTTVDQTAITDTVHIKYTVPANSVAVGTVFRIHTWGNIDNGTTAITFTPKLKWGSSPILATPTFNASTTANTNRAYSFDAMVTIRTLGSGLAGSAMAESHYIERSTSTTGVETTHADNTGATAVTSCDTTVASDLSLTWAMSSTTGTPHIRTFGGTIEVVKP